MILRLILEKFRWNDFDRKAKRAVQELQIHIRLARADPGDTSIPESYKFRKVRLISHQSQ